MNLPDGREAKCIGQIVAWFTKVSGAVVQSTLRAVAATVPETFLKQIVCTGLILALAGCGRPLAEKPGPPPRPNPPLFSMGQPNAKVRVEAFYPLDDEHKWVVTTLHDAAQTFGEKVLIRAFDIGTDWGRREWQKRGLQCGGVLINDKSCFTVDAQKVSFLRNPGDSTWTENQLWAVIAHEVDNAYRPAGAEPRPSQAKGPTPLPAVAAGGTSLFMFCSAGLREPMEAMRAAFEKQSGVSLRMCYAGSACLLAQIEITQRGDLYMPGEKFYIDQASARGFVVASRRICYFIPVIMVAKGNPHKIVALRDLTRPGLKVGVGEPRSCAIGKTTAELLDKHKLDKGLGGNIVVRTGTAPELGNALKLGSIDAAVNWDAVAAWYEDACDVIPIPEPENILVECPLGVLKFSKSARMAGQFLEFAAGENGRAILHEKRYTTDLKQPVYPSGL
jgi:molybdate transport system substrate-binding protein